MLYTPYLGELAIISFPEARIHAMDNEQPLRELVSDHPVTDEFSQKATCSFHH